MGRWAVKLCEENTANRGLIKVVVRGVEGWEWNWGDRIGLEYLGIEEGRCFPGLLETN